MIGTVKRVIDLAWFQRAELMTPIRTIQHAMRNSLLAAMSVSSAWFMVACDRGPTAIVADVPQNASADAQAQDNLLAANDRIRVVVVGQEKLSREFAVDGSGMIVFPLLGPIQAGGRTTAELEEAIAAKLEPDYLMNPSVSVELVTRPPVFVVGEVENPGSFAYKPGTTVSGAIARAGGAMKRARMNELYIKRVSSEGKIVRLAVTAQTIVRPGDIVQVDER